MKKERSEQILSRGLKTAREQLRKYPSRVYYPHSYLRLYGWLEDKLYDLFNSICSNRHTEVLNKAGEIIVTASEIAEYAESAIEIKKGEREK